MNSNIYTQHARHFQTVVQALVMINVIGEETMNVSLHEFAYIFSFCEIRDCLRNLEVNIETLLTPATSNLK